jgi:uncharacterized protein
MNARFIIITLFLLVNLSAYSIKPDKKYIQHPDQLDMSYKEFVIKANDSISLKCWHIIPSSKSKHSNTSIIISYADLGNMSYWLNHASLLSNEGYDVWLYDYRGFGESSSFMIDSKILYYNEFIDDLSSVIEFVKIQTPTNTIGLLGFSMGGIINSIYIHKNPESNIKFCIIDGLVYNPETLASESKLKLPCLCYSMHRIYSKFSKPLLVFAGKADKICCLPGIENEKKQNSNIHIIKYKGGHLHSLMILKNKYIKDINTFINATSRHRVR